MFGKRIIHTVVTALCCCILLPCLALAAPKEKPGFTDPELFTRMTGYLGVDFKFADFNKYEFMITKNSKKGKERVEGRYSWYKYMLDPASGQNVSNLQVIRNYQNAAAKLGGKVVFDDDNQNSTVVIPRNNTEIWVHIHTGNSGKNYLLTIVEKQAMTQDVKANPMLDTIKQTGKVTLYINFDTGKAVIQPESFEVIDQIAAMLTSDQSLKIFVDGHTDNTGDAEGNQKLSEMRAESVKSALLDKGIDGSRLSARGFGRTKPIADNASDDGRAKNRRVELVKM